MEYIIISAIPSIAMFAIAAVMWFTDPGVRAMRRNRR